MIDASFLRSCARELTDRDPARRAGAAEILLTHGSAAAEVRPAIQAACADADPHVKRLATLTIAALDGDTGRLGEGLRDRNTEIRRACALACGAIGEKAAPLVPELVKLLDDEACASAA